MEQIIKAAALIKREDTYLLVQEKASRTYGLWNWPQGTKENEETLEQVAIREAKEETGLNIKLEKKLSMLVNTFPDTKELHVYLCSAEEGKINFPEGEILDVKYFTLEQVTAMKDQLVGDWVYRVILENS